MTDPSAPGAAPPPPNVAALVDAIDARARQAGNEGATAVMQRMLGSVSDVLASIQDRLDHVEDLLTSGGPGDSGGLTEALQTGLAAFNARLGRLEEAFVQAVDESGSGTQAVMDEVRTVVLRALEETADSASSSMPAAPGIDDETRSALSRVESTLERLTSAREERPAQEIVGLALSAMGERLDALEKRIVSAVHQPQPAAQADLSTLDLTAQLAPVHDRLDATEARMVTAVAGASREAVDAAVAPVLDRLDNVERRMKEASASSGSGTSVEDAFELVQVRIAALEQLVRTRSSERTDGAAEVRAAVAPLAERLHGLEIAQRAAGERQSERLGRVDASMSAIPGRFASLEERVWAVVSNLTEAGGLGLDSAVVTRFEEAVERLERDETSARLVGLVEERLSAGLRAVTERTDEVRRSIDQLASRPSAAEGVDERLDQLSAAVRGLHSASEGLPDAVSSALAGRLSPMGDRLGGLDARFDSIEDRFRSLAAAVAVPSGQVVSALAAVQSRLDELASRAASQADVADAVASLERRVEELLARPAGDAGVLDALSVLHARIDDLATPSTDAITGAVRREAELLTQRVAALAVGVEAARAMLEQHVQEGEHSIGRKAGEVTRRLAADFGIRTRRNGPGGRRDPRELGSG
jgi:uncharacterized phage infection (PIP) family protein YhgE